MPEPLLHFLAPFVACIIYGLSIKKSLFISSFAILPDLDVLFHVHRSISHSAVFIIAVSIPIILSIKYKYPQYFNTSIITSLVTISHPIMDTFCGHTPVLYPLYKGVIRIQCDLLTNINNIWDLKYIFNIDMVPISSVFVRSVDYDAAIFSSLGVIISIIVFCGIIMKWRNNK